MIYGLKRLNDKHSLHAASCHKARCGFVAESSHKSLAVDESEPSVHQPRLDLIVRSGSGRGFIAPSFHHKGLAEGVVCRRWLSARRAFLFGMQHRWHDSRLHDVVHRLLLYHMNHPIVDFIVTSTCFEVLFTACIFDHSLSYSKPAPLMFDCYSKQ